MEKTTYYEYQTYRSPSKASKFWTYLCKDGHSIKKRGHFLREGVDLLTTFGKTVGVDRMLIRLVFDCFQHLFGGWKLLK